MPLWVARSRHAAAAEIKHMVDAGCRKSSRRAPGKLGRGNRNVKEQFGDGDLPRFLRRYSAAASRRTNYTSVCIYTTIYTQCHTPSVCVCICVYVYDR